MGYRSPQFPPEILNLYQLMLTIQNRINNHAETANRRLNIEIMELIQQYGLL